MPGDHRAAPLIETTVARDNLLGIRNRGVCIAIDDVGTGYASLAYLHRDPIDMLKIDRSFIAGIATSSRDNRLCQAIITMANLLGLSVAAEGVELDGQAAQLRTMDCPAAQGEHYSPAVPPTQMTVLIDRVFACAD